MEISEFRPKLRELLDDGAQLNDEDFWERAVGLFASVANPRLDAREREAKQTERERRLAVVMGWSGYIWDNAQVAAIKAYVNDGVVSDQLPRMYRLKASKSHGR